MTTLKNEVKIPWIDETGYWQSSIIEKIPHLHFNSSVLANHLSKILEDYQEPIYDLGCGNCFYIKHLSKKHTVLGIEKQIPKSCNGVPVSSYNLAEPLPDLPKGVVLSFEVGEHIPAKYESQFVKNITNLCNSLLIISWAGVNQPGFGHVNCKDSKDVIKLFEDSGFSFNESLTNLIRQNHTGMTSYFAEGLLVFNKND